MNRNLQFSDNAIKRLDSLKLSGKALGMLVKAFTEKGVRIQFRARGDSMFPFINDGNTVMISPYFDKIPEAGDIVAFIDSKTERLIVHRLMSLSGDGFTAKGDNCIQKDGPQPRENILGYVSKINNGKLLWCGINYIGIKNFIRYISKIGLIAIFGRIFRKIELLCDRTRGGKTGGM